MMLRVWTTPTNYAETLSSEIVRSILLLVVGRFWRRVGDFSETLEIRTVGVRGC